MSPWFAGPDDPEPALRTGLTACADMWGRHRAVLRAISENWLAVPELRDRWTKFMNNFVDDVVAEIDRQRAIGLAPPGADSRTIATTLTWAGERMSYVTGVNMYGDNHERDMVDGLLSIWLGAIYQQAPSSI